MFSLNDLKITGRFWFLYTDAKNTHLLVLLVAGTAANFDFEMRGNFLNRKALFHWENTLASFFRLPTFVGIQFFIPYCLSIKNNFQFLKTKQTTMKKFFFLSVAATLTCSISFAKVWRVNNNVGVNADFTTAQAATSAATVLAGDTIHLEPSTTSYGSLTTNKRLTWISTGAFLVANPNQQFSLNIGRLDGMTVGGTGNLANNSVFHIYIDGFVNIDASNIRIDRCFIAGALNLAGYVNSSGSSLVVINSWIQSNVSISQGNNNVVTNNIIGGNINGTSLLTVYTHNVIHAISAGASTVTNAIVENNIFNKSSSAYTFNNCTVQFNMSGAASVLPAGNNNQNSVAMANVFVNNSGADDVSFVLKAASPAIAAGSAGVDLGAFGGGSPFKLAIQPAIPAIYKIQAPAAPSGNTLNVTFSTKSNN